ncbi:MAG: OmpA family protein [Phycisphaerales bacterium]|jgi:chemotaxis protein MotB|nr:OmpA family protein [Phycisphaeraceae bacterium]
MMTWSTLMGTPRIGNVVGARRMKACLLGLSAFAALAGGCVNQDSYDELRKQNEVLTARNQQLLDQVTANQKAIDELMARAGRGDLMLDEANRLIAQLRADIAARDSQLADFERKFGGLTLGGPLDAATNEALEQLARQFPDVFSYDPAKGMLRFNSDVTFASGSFELTSEAQQAIGAAARVLRDLPSAAQYDFVVVGHTDSQRVRQVAGRRFVDNDELSAFRSISVQRALTSNGIGKNRILFGGYGESRPQVENTPSGNTPANRRVELYLTKSTLSASAPGMPTTPARAATPARTTTPAAPAGTPSRAEPDIMK